MIALTLRLAYCRQAATLLNGCLEWTEGAAADTRGLSCGPEVDLATRLLHGRRPELQYWDTVDYRGKAQVVMHVHNCRKRNSSRCSNTISVSGSKSETTTWDPIPLQRASHRYVSSLRHFIGDVGLNRTLHREIRLEDAEIMC